MSRTAALALLALLALPVRAEGEPTIEDLWRDACLWQVGSNAEKVPAARAALIARGTSVLDFIIPGQLDTADTLVTRALSDVLTGLGREAVTPKLLPLLQHEKPLIRRNAADLLGALGATEAAPGIARLLSDPDARLGALTALGALKSAETVPAIAALLPSDAPERVRVSAAVTLGQLGGAEASAALVQGLASPAAAVRFACEESLAKLKATEVLLRLLASTDDRLRLHAIDALARAGDTDAAGAILKLLRDPSPVVRAHAVEAARGLRAGAPAATDAALAALRARETDALVRSKLE